MDWVAWVRVDARQGQIGLGRVGGGRRTTGADSRGDAGRQIHTREKKGLPNLCLYPLIA
jgi:hypothetical protein